MSDLEHQRSSHHRSAPRRPDHQGSRPSTRPATHDSPGRTAPGRTSGGRNSTGTTSTGTTRSTRSSHSPSSRHAAHQPSDRPRHHHHVDRKPILIVGVVATVLCGFFALASRNDDGIAQLAAADAASAAAADVAAAPALEPATDPGTDPAAAQAAAATDPAASTGSAAGTDPAVADPAAATDTTALPDLDGEELTTSDSCLMDVLSVRIGATGKSVTCLQQALAAGGFYTGAVTGTFDQQTFTAVEAMQTDRKLFVDGIVGRESAISLGIWPDEESFVVRTPAPPAGAVDLLGYPLSSVASAGDNAPPLPANSGSGKRLVYDRAGQRVWAVDDDGRILRSWLVSGSKYSNEMPGTHEVYSRSEVSTAWNGQAYLPHMVRWLKTDIGAIGFHGIPTHVSDGSAYQTEAELGTRLSGGCQRQANRDADFVWDFAQIGTTVVVI